MVPTIWAGWVVDSGSVHHLLVAMLSTGELTFAGDEHLHQLDNIARDDEPETTASIDENIVGLDHDGLVIWEFSDDSNDGVSDAGVVDEW